jgi:hypothetical protein
VSKVRILIAHLFSPYDIKFIRCIAPPDDLDRKPEAARRCKAHTELLVENLELGVLWDEYGLVGDVVVGLLSSHFFLVVFASFL